MVDLFLAIQGAFTLISRFSDLPDSFPPLPLHHLLSVVWSVFASLPAITTILINRSKLQSTEIATI